MGCAAALKCTKWKGDVVGSGYERVLCYGRGSE